MLFPEQRSTLIEKADEPVRLIANFPDLVSVVFPSLNPFVTRAPPLTSPNA